jgi:hypothetical protein
MGFLALEPFRKLTSVCSETWGLPVRASAAVSTADDFLRVRMVNQPDTKLDWEERPRAVRFLRK